MHDSLTEFGDQITLPKAHLKLQVLNMFVNEVVRQLKALRQEDVLLIYLECLEMFTGSLSIPGRKTSMRLHTVLFDYTTPGSPLYPTRNIRVAAQKTLDNVFPSGKLGRKIVNWSFRVFHPVELVKSWWFWIWNYLLWVFMYLKHFLYSIFSLFR